MSAKTIDLEPIRVYIDSVKIAFTGHRNKQVTTTDLESIASEFPGSTWIHGGAVGFDSQVEEFAKSHGITTQVIRPDYARFGRPAPLIRDRQIVDSSDLVVACYDGRKTGGTFYTVKYARQKSKTLRILRHA